MRRAAACIVLCLLVAAAARAADRIAAPTPVPAPVTATPAVDALPAPAEILAVPAPLQEMLRQQVLARSDSREHRLQALLEMIFSRQGLDLQYDPNATYTITEVWRTHRANCLAFTLLFVTLARQAGIEAQVQEVSQVVSWYQDPSQGVVYSVGHVNASVSLGDRSGTVDLDRNVLYDQRGPRPIESRRALAHFYNNRGADRMAAGDDAGARQAFDAALAQDARFGSTWNNLGVLAARQGQDAQARQALERALALQPRQHAALNNASALYQRLGLHAQAEALQRRLHSVQRTDPFAQYMQGAAAERRGDLVEAIRHYRRAVRLYDSAHQFHFGLARAYFLSGQLREADRELQRAQALGGTPLQLRYQAKLDSLARWRRQQAASR